MPKTPPLTHKAQATTNATPPSPQPKRRQIPSPTGSLSNIQVSSSSSIDSFFYSSDSDNEIEGSGEYDRLIPIQPMAKRPTTAKPKVAVESNTDIVMKTLRSSPPSTSAIPSTFEEVTDFYHKMFGGDESEVADMQDQLFNTQGANFFHKKDDANLANKIAKTYINSISPDSSEGQS